MALSSKNQSTGQSVVTSTSRTSDKLDASRAEREHRKNQHASISTPPNPCQSRLHQPPRFTIDLSQPPERRYLEVCQKFGKQLRNLTPLFDEVVGAALNPVPLKWVRRLSSLLLRRIYDDEENRELKGISKATGVDMYLLVSFNVLLDLLMGCSSGGAQVRDENNGGSKMVHFRTLDWGMDSLRKVVVRLDFKTESAGPIVASSITYAGFVGTLTGVREGLSLSVNFRPKRNDKYKFWADARYYWHLLMVLLGWRRSISSQLRRSLLPKPALKSSAGPTWHFRAYDDIVSEFTGLQQKPLTTTSCYLCFCNGKETVVIEKDPVTAVLRKSDEIIAITNNDIDDESGSDPLDEQLQDRTSFARALAEIVREGRDRRQCAIRNYHSMRRKKASQLQIAEDDLSRVLETSDIVEMAEKYPTTNEMTHFACVLDPTEGRVHWCRRFKEPVTEEWMDEHEGER